MSLKTNLTKVSYIVYQDMRQNGSVGSYAKSLGDLESKIEDIKSKLLDSQLTDEDVSAVKEKIKKLKGEFEEEEQKIKDLKAEMKKLEKQTKKAQEKVESAEVGFLSLLVLIETPIILSDIVTTLTATSRQTKHQQENNNNNNNSTCTYFIHNNMKHFHSRTINTKQHVELRHNKAKGGNPQSTNFRRPCLTCNSTNILLTFPRIFINSSASDDDQISDDGRQ